MNSKEIKAARVQLFRDAANFKKTDRIPHFANVVTWKVFDAGYTLDKAMTTSLWVPFPKEKMELLVYRRSSETGLLVQLYETTIDPQSKIIRHGRQNDWNVYTVQEMGDPENHVDLVFVAEGYTAEEMDKLMSVLDKIPQKDFKEMFGWTVK